MSTTITPTEQNIEINVNNDVIDINVTNEIVDVNATTQQIDINVAGAYPIPNPVLSVFGRTGVVVATEGDYTLTQLGDVTLTSPTNGQVLKYNGTTWVNGTDAGGLTSVGLSMPTAFTVTNSPLTSNGTIAVTGAGTTAQYVRGDGTLATFPSIITQAQNLVTEVYNRTGATLTKGTIVYINGGQGNLPTVTKALAVGDSTSAQTYGVVQTDITNMNNGYVVVAGRLSDLDTQAYTEGTQLYLSSTTAGTWTSTKQYAPAHLVYVGIVVRAHPTQGIVEIKIQNGYELDEIHNVAAQTPTNNDGLFWESATSLWKNKSIATILGGTPVTGTGTINTIPLWNAFSNITNSVITQVSSNIRVGTTTQTSKLNIGGDLDVSGVLKSNGTQIINVGSGSLALGDGTGKLTTSDVIINTTAFTVAIGSSFAPYAFSNFGSITGNSFIKIGGTSTQFLKADGSVDSTSYQPILTNPITGTGTSGQVAYFNGTNSITSESNLFWDATNDRLGIGTATPSSPLDIIGSATSGFDAIKFRGQYTQIGYLATSNSAVYLATGAGVTGSYLELTSASANLRAGTTNITFTIASERARINNNGNFLINTTTDAGFRLDVNGTARVQNNLQIQPNAGGNIYLGIDSTAPIRYTDSAGKQRINYFVGSTRWTISGGSNTAFQLDDAFLFSTTTDRINLLARISKGYQAVGRNISGDSQTVLQLDNNYQGTAINGGVLTGLYVDLNTTGFTTYRAIQTTTGDVLLGTTSGNVAIGTSTLATATELTLGGSQTASSAIARGQLLNTTLVAAANNDVLVGLDINPTFTNGAFTGVTNIAARLLQPTGAGGNNTLRLANNSGNANSIQFWSTNTAAQQSSIVSTNSTFAYGTYVANQLNLFGGTGGIGIRTNNSAPIRFYATNADGDFSTVQMQMFGATGNVTLQNGGTFTDAGFRLDVNGTARVSGLITGSDGATFGNTVNITRGFSTATFNVGDGGTTNSSTIRIIKNATGNAANLYFRNVSTDFTRLWLNASNNFEIANQSTSGLFATFFSSSNNIGIGTGTDVASSILTIESTTKGFLPPRMTTTQKTAISSPATGLAVYDTTLNQLSYYNGTSWINV